MKPAHSSNTTSQECQAGSVDHFDKKLVSFIKKKERYAKVKFTVKESRLWNARDKSGNTLLHIAARHNNDAIAQYLLDSGVSKLDEPNKAGKTPLILAVENGCKRTSEILLRAGASVHHRDYSGKNALHWYLGAEFFGGDVARLFLDRVQADCRNDNERISSVLCDAGWPLYHVVLLRNVEVSAIMLSRGERSVHDRDRRNQTALHKAVQLVDARHVRLLLEHRADPNAMDDAHRSPLHYVYECDRRATEEHLEILKMLISRDAALSLADEDDTRWSQVDVTLRYGNEAAIEVLMRANLEIDYQVDGLLRTTPIHILARNHNPHAFRPLDNWNFNVNARDAMFQTPLWIAASHGNASALEYLLKRGADVDAVNNTNTTALHCAVNYCTCNCGDQFKDCAELLLEHGADLQIASRSFDVTSTIFDVVSRSTFYDLGEIVVAHLVLRESLDVLVVSESVKQVLRADATLGAYREACQRQLSTIVDNADGATILDLLSSSDAIIERCARNRLWLARMRRFCSSRDDACYLDRMLLRRIDKAERIVRLRTRAARVLGDRVMMLEYDSFYLLADAIVAYLGERDLENLLRL